MLPMDAIEKYLRAKVPEANAIKPLEVPHLKSHGFWVINGPHHRLLFDEQFLVETSEDKIEPVLDGWGLPAILHSDSAQWITVTTSGVRFDKPA